MNYNIAENYIILRKEVEFYYNKYEECLEEIDYYTSKGWPNKHVREDLYDRLGRYSGAVISKVEYIAKMEAQNPSLASVKI